MGCVGCVCVCVRVEKIPEVVFSNNCTFIASHSVRKVCGASRGGLVGLGVRLCVCVRMMG